MAQFPNIFNCDLHSGPVSASIRQMYLGDIAANRVGVRVTDNGEAVALSGTCSGTAMLYNGGTVALTGVVDGNVAYVDLPAAVYSVEGPLQIFVTLTQGGSTTTLLEMRSNVTRTETGVVIDPGTIIPTVAALISDIEDAVASIPEDYSELSADVVQLKADMEDVQPAVETLEDDVSSLKSAIAGMTTATASDEGKALKAKTVSGGKVTGWEFGEAVTLDDTLTQAGEAADAKATGDAIADKITEPTTEGTSGQVLTTNGNGGRSWTSPQVPTDAQIQSAVDDWLDDHPEATTTVEDGAITKAKINNSFLPEIKNNYVTPEMYGAVGDGSADDTDAINAALSSGFNVYFSNKTYITSGADVNNYIRIYFDNTTLKANTNYQDHLLKVQGQILIDGHLTVNGNYKAMHGVVFTSSYGSVVNRVTATYCNAWGVVIKDSGHMTFDYIYTMECGIRADFTVSYQSDYVVKIDSTLSDRIKQTLLTQYCFETFLYDKSSYESSYPGKKIWRATGFDEETETITLYQQAPNKIPTDYLSKNSRLCMGGGVLIGSGNNGQINFGIIDTRLGPIGIGVAAPYGHYVGSYYSQGDSIPVAVYNYSLGGYYGSVTMEAPDSGHKFVSYNYDYSVVVTQSTGYDYPFTSEDAVNIGGSSYTATPILIKTASRRALPNGYRSSAQPTITEKTNDTYIIMRNTSIKLNLSSTYGDGFTNGYDPWVVKTLYFMPDSNLTGDFTVTLDSGLVSKGYSIENGTNGTLVFTRPSRYFKMLIFLQSKRFIIFTEAITPQASNAT